MTMGMSKEAPISGGSTGEFGRRNMADEGRRVSVSDEKHLIPVRKVSAAN